MIKYPLLEECKASIRKKNDQIADQRDKWINANPYYYKILTSFLKFIIKKNSRVLQIRCSTGFILDKLETQYGLGIDDSLCQVELAKKNYPHLDFKVCDLENFKIDDKFDYILITYIEDVVDIKALLDSLKKLCHSHTRLIVVHYNFLWEPIVKLAELFRLKFPQRLHNWISRTDLNHLLKLSNFETISNKDIILFPYNIPFISYLLNRFVARLPFCRGLTLIKIAIARQLVVENDNPSVSIVIPCKDEAGNVEDAVKRIPDLGTRQEIIFCDDQSTDGTASKVREMIKKYPQKNIKLFEGPGICKAENVWVGFDHAKNDILMILDADLTVLPEELLYFYEAISKNYGEFINGSRLVYPMHGKAMSLFNVIGNKLFSVLFSFIFDTDIKDTLCGTKTLWRRDFENIKVLRGSWGIRDRWGDFELLFGAARMQLKIIDLPVHYVERTYGVTKMNHRIKNGLIMLRMCITALFKLKFQ